MRAKVEGALRFMQHDAAGGLALLVAALLALFLANSPLDWLYDHLLATPLVVQIGALKLDLMRTTKGIAPSAMNTIPLASIPGERKKAKLSSWALWRDAQVRGFVTFLAAVSVILAGWLTATREISFADALRASAFNVTSIVTTTGFASADYQLWGPFAVGLFFLLTFVGGCSGSTAGAIKIYRLQVAGILTRSHFLHLISPSRVVTLVYNGRRLPEDVPFSVVSFLAIYMATVGIFALLLTAMGLDFVTSLSAAATAMSNVGPGLGDIVGPAGNFATLPAGAKWVLSLAMILGRLELFTVLVLLRPEFWRR